MRRKIRTSIKLALLSLLLVAVASLAQDSQYKIRAKVDLVVVPVTVKGSGDKLVSGLKKDDFVVLEDGKRQDISSFSVDPVPLSAVVVVDTGVSFDALSRVQNTFSALAGAFSAFDEVEVYRFDKFVTKLLDFSDNPEKIETALKTIREIKPDANAALAINAPGPFSIPGPVINGYPVLPPAQASAPPTQTGILVTPNSQPSKVLHDAMYEAATELGKREKTRRKIVLVISDGVVSGSEHSFDEASKALLSIGAEVYAVGVSQPFPFKKVSVLDDYAKNTGGDVFFVGSKAHMERAFMVATEEARNQYVLGYISNNEIQGAGPVFRIITVQIPDKDLHTLHRKGYYQYP
jgi:VWFA-related protein